MLVWLPFAYLAGALPWSVWLGRLFFHADPRSEGDHNPGTANAFRAAGWRLGVSVLLLDFSKALIPVALGRWVVGISGVQLFWLALMPTLGHAFSPFLRFRGGRGIVVIFGVWTALTLYQVPTLLGLTAIVGTLLIKNAETRSLLLLVALLGFLALTHAPQWMLALAIAQLLVLCSKIAVYLLEQRNAQRLGAS